MPNGGSITGLLFQDFIFENDNGQITPGQNGPFFLPANATVEVKAGAQTIDINVSDDDAEFDDGFQDDPGGTPLNQILEDDIATTDAEGNPIFVSAGSVLEVEFTLTATPQGGGDPIDLLFVAAGPGENQGDLVMVVTTAPLVPGVVYDLAFKNDGGGTEYSEIICFARGTRILTPDGYVRVESLSPGDLVQTVDDGAQPVLWTARRALLRPVPETCPVRIRANAFGPGRPFADLLVSPQHCLLWEGAAAQLLFGSNDVISSAKNFVNDQTVIHDTATDFVEYHHILFARHQLITANGLMTESFYPGVVGRRSLGAQTLASLAQIYPGIDAPDAPAPFEPVRPILKAHELSVAMQYAELPGEIRLARMM